MLNFRIQYISLTTHVRLLACIYFYIAETLSALYITSINAGYISY